MIGAEELEAVLKRSPQIAIKELSRAIDATAARVEFVAKREAPIEYGNLRGSINTQGPRVIGNDIQASVGTNVEYARYQEEGTGIYGPSKRPITAKDGGLLVFMSGGKKIFARSVKGVKAKRYFRTAKQDATPYFTERMRGALARIVSTLATS